MENDINFIRLKSGFRYYFTEPLSRNNGLNMCELLAGLVGVNRFSGQVKWDVLRHSILVKEESLRRAGQAPTVVNKLSTAALFHDLTEAVMGDVSTPLKRLLPDYRALYDKHEKYLNKLFHIHAADAIIHKVDKAIGEVELAYFFSTPLNMDVPYVSQNLLYRTAIRIAELQQQSDDDIVKKVLNEYLHYLKGEGLRYVSVH